MAEAEALTLAELEVLARGGAENDPAKLYGWFKFLVDDRKGRSKWQALRFKDRTLDRDELVVRVWKELETKHKAAIEERYHSLEYHRLWLFDWLLRRYDIRRARSVVGRNAWAERNVQFLLLGAVVGVFLLRRAGGFGSFQTHWVLVLCAGAYAAVLIVLARSFRQKLTDYSEALTVATHSLILRLAGAGAVGLVILASSQELLNVVVDTKPWWLIVLLVAGYGYLLLEMARRVHPLPRLPHLLLHAVDIAATALAHSLTLALLAEGALRKVLLNNGESHQPFGWCESFSVVVFVFSIGLVVNLIWAEEPVTEPL